MDLLSAHLDRKNEKIVRFVIFSLFPYFPYFGPFLGPIVGPIVGQGRPFAPDFKEITIVKFAQGPFGALSGPEGRHLHIAG